MSDQRTKAASLSVLSNTFLVLTKLIIGLSINSVSILSEAIHSAMDLLAAVIAYFSVRFAAKPADEKHRYGHGKIENIAGTVEALLIAIAAFWIVYEAIHKLMAGNHFIEAIGLGVLVMAVSTIINFFVSKHLLFIAQKTDSIALEADGMHLLTDVYTSLGVVIGLTAVWLTGWAWLDPVIAILVALFILRTAFRLTKEAFLPLLDEKLPVEEENRIIMLIEKHAGEYIEFHKLRTRKAGSERHIDLHLVVPKFYHVDRVHELCNQIESDITNDFPQAHVLTHVEPCAERCDQCSACQTR